MASFIDQEAQLSEGNESDTSEIEPLAKRPKKEKKRKHRISSDDEDEEEDEGDPEEMRGFIVEEGEGGAEEGAEEPSEDESDKGSEVSEGLLDDELELLNENIGQNVRGRVAICDSEDDDDERERIKNSIFGQGDDPEEEARVDQPQYSREYEEESRSESEDSEGHFIIDDGPNQRRHKKKGKKFAVSDQTLDDAKEIFGVDIGEFYEDDEALEEDYEDGDEIIRPAKSRGQKVTLLDTIEPSELERGFVRTEDKKIICEDRPERFQVRKIPVIEIDDHDLNLEARWIHKYAFDAPTLSKQTDTGLSILIHAKGTNEAWVAERDAPEKILEAIRFIRNQLFEVPFIAFYRKEYVESSLLMPDLWKTYQYDEKWCRLQARKSKIMDLLKRISNYIDASGSESSLKRISEKDLNDVLEVQTNEELMDVHHRFQLYYGAEMNRIQEWERQTKDQMDGEMVSRFKLSNRTDQYQTCVQCGLSSLVEQFGLTPEEFADNLTEYVKHDVRQVGREPKEAAKEYITGGEEGQGTFPTPEKVIQGAVYMLAMQFSREVGVRKKLRQIYREHLLISVYPTKKGRNEIDENHSLYERHYIKDKPVPQLKDDDYLQYVKARNDGLLEINLHVATADPTNNWDNIVLQACSINDRVPTFKLNEFSYIVEEWNRLRSEVLRVCVNEILMPIFQREAHEKLMEEARECVLRNASKRLHDLIEFQAYKPTFSYESGDDDMMPDTGTRIMAICYSPDKSEASFAVVIDQDGQCLDHQRLVNFTKRINRYNQNESDLKKEDLKSLFKLMQNRQPHLIVISGEDLEAQRLFKDVEVLAINGYENGVFPHEIPVEIANCEAARVYMNSRMARDEFESYPPLLRQAVSLARFALDPLVEICHLCNAEDDILYMKFHPLQNEVSRQDLLSALQIVCINRVNEVGVDINRCLEFPYTAGLLQFVCGLGPRKASHLLKILKQHDNLLESRTKLVTFCRMGPKVFMNAAGFIKIDTAKIVDRTDAYVEVLDGSRVHPETYEWARKMAVDALELEDPTDQTVALEEILKAPERLKELDLDAFAEELNRQGFGNKSITLYDIRAELNYRYKDLRTPHRKPTNEELAQMLLKDDYTKIQGKLVLGEVLRLAYRKPKDSEKENSLAVFNTGTNKWGCPFCKREEFLNSTIVQEHFEKGDCPGIAMGVRAKLDNGLLGFCHTKNMSDNQDKHKDLGRLFRTGQTQYFRVIRFNIDRFECELSCKTSDLQRNELGNTDPYFDRDRFEAEKKAEVEKQRGQSDKNKLHNRVTSHPSFHNVTFKDAEKMLRKMDQGEAIIRPSGKSINHLTVTWKVSNDVYQHIPVEEQDKQRPFEIGKKLIINNETYEDLDEILARHIQPMASYARDILSYKYYMEGVSSRETVEEHLREQRRNTPQRIPYTISACREHPGKFVLSYLGGIRVRHEMIGVTPEGIKLNGKFFTSISECIDHFKVDFAKRQQEMMHR